MVKRTGEKVCVCLSVCVHFMCVRIRVYVHALCMSKWNRFVARMGDVFFACPSVHSHKSCSLVAVSEYVGGGCSHNQCLHRWFNSINPQIKKGRWNKDEDEVSIVSPGCVTV